MMDKLANITNVRVRTRQSFLFFFVTVVCGLQVQHVMSYYDDMRDEGDLHILCGVWSASIPRTDNSYICANCKCYKAFLFFLLMRCYDYDMYDDDAS